MQVEGITKVQELIYSTKVETVMATDVVILDPDMPLEEAKSILKSKRISGAPVVEGENLVGMLSMSDVLTALENDKLDRVGSRGYDFAGQNSIKGFLSH